MPSTLRSQIATSAPNAANAMAVAAPMPCAAPVTTATLPPSEADDGSSAVTSRQVELEHADGVAAHDLVDDLVGEARHHLLRDLLRVGPRRVGVRVVGLERDVVDPDAVERLE